MRGDEQGEYTYTEESENSVIDYIITDEETREKIEWMEVGDKIESDYYPLIMEITKREK